MRRILLAAVLLTASTAVSAAPAPTSRIVRLERWLAALARHEPGTKDDATGMLEGWSINELRTLSIDLSSLITLIHNPRASYFTIAPEGRRRPEPIRYTSTDVARLRLLARAAGGTLSDEEAASAELRRLAASVQSASLHGDGNYLLKRGALLHADAAMAGPLTVEPPDRNNRSPGPRRITLLVQDGQPLDMGQGFVHWEIARFLLDKVVPPPAHDPMVRDFYQATNAWLLSQTQSTSSVTATSSATHPRACRRADGTG